MGFKNKSPLVDSSNVILEDTETIRVKDFSYDGSVTGKGLLKIFAQDFSRARFLNIFGSEAMSLLKDGIQALQLFSRSIICTIY